MGSEDEDEPQSSGTRRRREGRGRSRDEGRSACLCCIGCRTSKRTSNLEGRSYSELSLRNLRQPQSNKQMKEADLDIFISDIMKLFRDLESLSDLPKLCKTVKALHDAYSNCVPHRSYIAGLLLEEDYPEYANKMLMKLNNPGMFENDDIRRSFKNFYYTCGNYAAVSSDFASALASTSLPSLLKQNISHKPYQDKMQRRKIKSLLKITVSIIHSIVRDSANRHFFNEKSVKNNLANLLSNHDEEVHCLALFCLAYLVNEEETGMLEHGSKSMKYLVVWLDYALHESGQERRWHGYSPEEIASALAAIAVNDRLKHTIKEEGALPHLVEMANGTRTGEVNAAMRTLWNLSFIDKILKVLVNDHQMESLAQRLSTHEDEAIRKSALSVLWMIENSQKDEAEVSFHLPDDAKSYVFISYSWEDQELVLKVRDRLREVGIECWLDLEKMHQSTLESMAKGIEGCRAAMLCMSESYKRSENCRMEAAYAKKLKRPLVPLLMQKDYKPDGHLGILLGDSLYFDFSGILPFNQVMNNLLKEMHHVLHVCDTVDHTKAGPSTSERSWSTSDVAAWLDRCDLGNLKSTMGQINGELLHQFVELRFDSLSSFYDILDKRLKLSFFDSLKFVNALDKLKMSATWKAALSARTS